MLLTRFIMLLHPITRQDVHRRDFVISFKPYRSTESLLGFRHTVCSFFILWLFHSLTVENMAKMWLQFFITKPMNQIFDS